MGAWHRRCRSQATWNAPAATGGGAEGSRPLDVPWPGLDMRHLAAGPRRTTQGTAAGEQVGSKRCAIGSVKRLRRADEAAGSAAYNYGGRLAGFGWHARGLGFESP
jgi:hypothetical protein